MVPLTTLVRLWPGASSTVTTAPASQVPLMTWPAASDALLITLTGGALAMAPALTGLIVTAGATLSSVKANALDVVGLPAASVATALTLSAPWPRVTRSALVNGSACCTPVADTVLATLPAVPVSVTSTLAPASAVRLTTPAAAVASTRLMSGPALVAAKLTPGASVSSACSVFTSIRLALPAALVTEPARKVSVMLPLAMPSVGTTVTSQVVPPVPCCVTVVTAPLATVKLLVASALTASPKV